MALPKVTTGVTQEKSKRMKKTDPRIQVIRCKSCGRLRAHPRTDDTSTWNCGCGSIQFVASFPHPDEMELANRLYSRDFEEKNLYMNTAREIMDGWREQYGPRSERPKATKVILT